MVHPGSFSQSMNPFARVRVSRVLWIAQSMWIVGSYLVLCRHLRLPLDASELHLCTLRPPGCSHTLQRPQPGRLPWLCVRSLLACLHAAHCSCLLGAACIVSTYWAGNFEGMHMGLCQVCQRFRLCYRSRRNSERESQLYNHLAVKKIDTQTIVTLLCSAVTVTSVSSPGVHS